MCPQTFHAKHGLATSIYNRFAFGLGLNTQKKTVHYHQEMDIFQFVFKTSAQAHEDFVFTYQSQMNVHEGFNFNVIFSELGTD